jgi:hypothetical protein
MHTKLLTENDITRRARKVCEDIDLICSSGDAFTKDGFHRDPVQTLLMRRGSNRDNLITPIIEAAAIQAEKQAAGAGELFLKLIAFGLKNDIRRKSCGLETDDEWKIILDHLHKSSVPARKRDLSLLFSSGSLTYSRIMNEVFNVIRADDKVFVRKIATSKSMISRELGYTFEGLGVDPRFFTKTSWIRKNVKTFLIDGVIEKVSEIHHILEEASSQKTPCVIFCIDALPDISETLVKNFLMGNLDVILVKVPVVESHINTLVDLGTIFDLEPVAAARGDTISTGTRKQCSFAEKFIITRAQIAIEKQDTADKVTSHVMNLRTRISEDINFAPVLEPRIRSMSASTTKIEVGIDDVKNDPNIIERLDRTFRMMPRIMSSGFIKKSDFIQFSNDKMCLLFDRDYAIPTEMANHAIKVFLSTRSAIQSAAAGIETF